MPDHFEFALRDAFNADEQRMLLDYVIDRLLADLLENRLLSICGSKWLSNLPDHLEVPTESAVKFDQIIEELGSPKIHFPFEEFGEYFAQRKRRRGPGKHATIRFGERWYMLSVCGQLKPFHRLRTQEKQACSDKPMTSEELKEFVRKNRE